MRQDHRGSEAAARAGALRQGLALALRDIGRTERALFLLFTAPGRGDVATRNAATSVTSQALLLQELGPTTQSLSGRLPCWSSVKISLGCVPAQPMGACRIVPGAAESSAALHKHGAAALAASLSLEFEGIELSCPTGAAQQPTR